MLRPQYKNSLDIVANAKILDKQIFNQKPYGFSLSIIATLLNLNFKNLKVNSHDLFHTALYYRIMARGIFSMWV